MSLSSYPLIMYQEEDHLTKQYQFFKFPDDTNYGHYCTKSDTSTWIYTTQEIWWQQVKQVLLRLPQCFPFTWELNTFWCASLGNESKKCITSAIIEQIKQKVCCLELNGLRVKKTIWCEHSSIMFDWRNTWEALGQVTYLPCLVSGWTSTLSHRLFPSMLHFKNPL